MAQQRAKNKQKPRRDRRLARQCFFGVEGSKRVRASLRRTLKNPRVFSPLSDRCFFDARPILGQPPGDGVLVPFASSASGELGREPPLPEPDGEVLGAE